MKVNKIILNTENGEEVLLDLTTDTVTVDTLKQGVIAHNSAGEIIIGTLATQTYYTGSNDPDSSLGNDGDLYLKV